MLDASAALVLVLEDEAVAPVMPILDALRTGDAVVPALWWFEVASGLDVARRRGRIDAVETARAVEALVSLNAVRDDEPVDIGVLIAIAERHGVSTYDAAYVGLALRRGLRLATIDARLARAARSAGVPLVP